VICAQGLVKHTARLRWTDRDGHLQSERHAAWDACEATTKAYRRARSMMLAGEARSYRIDHHEGTVEAGTVIDFPSPFAIPPMPVHA
jgi:hypothetical protein